MPDHPINFEGNIDRFSGFASLYDQYRPTPPAVLADILKRLAQAPDPQLIIDLGCGTGLSTRYWAGKARRVTGIEPSADMRHQAEAQTPDGHISYQEGFSHQTGLPGQCADIVTCSQALHWMEPQSTFEEAARILRPGRVFAAYDYDWPPLTGYWEADLAYKTCIEYIQGIEKEFKLKTPLQQWDKGQHLARMQASGCFRYCREIVLHQVDQGCAERLVGLLLSQGGVMTLLKAGWSEEQLGIDQFREKVEKILGPAEQTWYWSSRVRFGIV